MVKYLSEIMRERTEAYHSDQDRPDILFAAKEMARFMSQPNTVAWNMAWTMRVRVTTRTET